MTAPPHQQRTEDVCRVFRWGLVKPGFLMIMNLPRLFQIHLVVGAGATSRMDQIVRIVQTIRPSISGLGIGSWHVDKKPIRLAAATNSRKLKHLKQDVGRNRGDAAEVFASSLLE